MDFVELARITNKDVPDWGVEEIQSWCDFLNLAIYKDTFAQNIKSGKELLNLSSRDIEQRLGISKQLHIRKIVKWIEKVFIQYRLFYANSILSTVTYMVLYPQQTSQKKYLKVAYELCESNLKIGSAKGCHVHLDGKEIKARHAEIKFNNGKYLIQDLGSQTGTYLKIREIQLTPGIIFMIGSQMIEVEDIQEDRKLSMSDLFNIKKQVLDDQLINNKGEIGEFQIIEVPQQQNQNNISIQGIDQLTQNFDNMKIPPQQIFISFKVFNYLSFDQVVTRFELQFDSKTKNTYTIGRKKINQIHFINDMEMSGNHAQIIFDNNKIFLNDRQSKNGIWLRLSSSDKKSDQFVLQNGMSIRFGYYNDYKCFLGMLKEEKAQKGFSYNRVEKYCLRCFNKYHNTMLIPCSHQVYCKDCISLDFDNINKICPECSNEYWDYVEILN